MAKDVVEDPRGQVEVVEVTADGRLAGRRFADRAEAEAWAQPDEHVEEINLICACDR